VASSRDGKVVNIDEAGWCWPLYAAVLWHGSTDSINLSPSPKNELLMRGS
jgi:hypothetical protein